MIENHVENQAEGDTNQTGELIVIFGPMFSGKTGELIDLIDREGYADRNAKIFKPSNDTRYHPDKVVTHSGREIEAYPIDKESPLGVVHLIREIENGGEVVNIVAIDEAQFFNGEMVEVIGRLLNNGKDVIVAGLASDFRDEPFGIMPETLSKADRIVHMHAVCTYRGEDGNVCGSKLASKTQRIIDGEPAHYDNPIIAVGGEELYEARCRQHHEVPGRPQGSLPQQEDG